MHNAHKLVNWFQTPAERAYKYSICRMARLSRIEADRLRDWNWSSIWGFISISAAPDIDKAAILDLIEDGYQSFKGIEKEPKYKPTPAGFYRERRR